MQRERIRLFSFEKIGFYVTCKFYISILGISRLRCYRYSIHITHTQPDALIVDATTTAMLRCLAAVIGQERDSKEVG